MLITIFFYVIICNIKYSSTTLHIEKITQSNDTENSYFLVIRNEYRLQQNMRIYKSKLLNFIGLSKYSKSSN